MKELSTEEKAKRYDEAIKKAKDMLSYKEVRREDMEYLFPELKESEDEKIRKALIEMVHDTTGDSLWVDYNVHKEDAFAWLEKQGKNNMGISETTKQKLEDNLNKALEKETPESCNEFLEKQYSQILANSAKTCKDEQKPAWSEEDETTKNNISYIIRQYDKISKKENQPCWYVGDCLLWMQNIKDRVQPQPKQEWSEEYEKRIKNIEESLLAYKIIVMNNDMELANYIEKEINWLKSLKDRYTWKPSNEQMDAIKDAIDYFGGNTKIVRKHLMSLYDQLKKLKE